MNAFLVPLCSLIVLDSQNWFVNKLIKDAVGYKSTLEICQYVECLQFTDSRRLWVIQNRSFFSNKQMPLLSVVY